MRYLILTMLLLCACGRNPTSKEVDESVFERVTPRGNSGFYKYDDGQYCFFASHDGEMLACRDALKDGE